MANWQLRIINLISDFFIFFAGPCYETRKNISTYFHNFEHILTISTIRFRNFRTRFRNSKLIFATSIPVLEMNPLKMKQSKIKLQIGAKILCLIVLMLQIHLDLSVSVNLKVFNQLGKDIFTPIDNHTLLCIACRF